MAEVGSQTGAAEALVAEAYRRGAVLSPEAAEAMAGIPAKRVAARSPDRYASLALVYDESRVGMFPHASPAEALVASAGSSGVHLTREVAEALLGDDLAPGYAALAMPAGVGAGSGEGAPGAPAGTATVPRSDHGSRGLQDRGHADLVVGPVCLRTGGELGLAPLWN